MCEYLQFCIYDNRLCMHGCASSNSKHESDRDVTIVLSAALMIHNMRAIKNFLVNKKNV